MIILNVPHCSEHPVTGEFLDPRGVVYAPMLGVDHSDKKKYRDVETFQAVMSSGRPAIISDRSSLTI
jgi:hypothetical protein